MTMKRLRKLRHWKQQFDPNAKFIWRKNVLWEGNPIVPETEIPESLKNNPVKLKRFWEAGVIELYAFEEPDVLTGRVPEPKEDLDADGDLGAKGESDSDETTEGEDSDGSGDGEEGETEEAEEEATEEDESSDDDSWLDDGEKKE